MAALSFQVRLLLVITTVLILPDWAFCQATPQGCQHVITALPTTIRTSGHWCIKRNLIFTPRSDGGDSAIVVLADQVTVDLGGYLIDGGGDPRSGVGVSVSADAYSVTIQNGTLHGFNFGVWRDWGNGGGNTTIQDLTVSDSLVQGISLQGVGRGDTVRRCRVSTSSASSVSYNIGIAVQTLFGAVVDNVVVGSAIGIVAYGTILIQGNYVDGGQVGIEAGAIELNSSAGVCRDNTVVNAMTPYSGCVMFGVNHP